MVRDTIWTFPEKSGKHPGLETPRFSFSQMKKKKQKMANTFFWRVGTTPIFEKIKAPRMHGQMRIFHVAPHEFRESLPELLREFWFSHCTTRETPLREWDFAFRELFAQLRELLWEYPGTLPELWEWPFHSESVFLWNWGGPQGSD